MIKRIFIFIVILVTFHAGRAQNYCDKNYCLIDSLDLDALPQHDIDVLDSLLTIYHEANHDSTRINTLLVIINNMSSYNWKNYNLLFHDMILKNLNAKALSRGDSHKYAKLEAESIYLLGMSNHYENNYPKAIAYYTEAIAKYELWGKKSGLARCYNNLGSIYFSLGDYKKANESNHKSLQIKKALHDTLGLGVSYNNIAYNYYIDNEIDSSIYYYLQSYDIVKNDDNVNSQATILSNLGLMYFFDAKYDTSLKILHKALKLRASLKDNFQIAISYNLLGRVYVANLEVRKGIDYYFKSIALNKKLKSRTGIANGYSFLGNAYFDVKKIEKATFYLNKSIAVFDSIYKHDENMVADLKRRFSNTLINLSNIQYEQKQYEQALFNAQKSLELTLNIGYDKDLIEVHQKIGEIFIMKNQLDDAESSLNSSLRLSEEINFGKGISSSCIALSQMYLMHGDYKKSMLIAERGLAIAKTLGLHENVKKGAKILAEIHLKHNNPDHVKSMFTLYSTYTDSISDALNTRAVKIAENDYLFYEEKLTDSLMLVHNNEIKALKNAHNKSEKKYIIAIALVITLPILIWLIVVYISYRNRKNHKPLPLFRRH